MKPKSIPALVYGLKFDLSCEDIYPNFWFVEYHQFNEIDGSDCVHVHWVLHIEVSVSLLGLYVT